MTQLISSWIRVLHGFLVGLFGELLFVYIEGLGNSWPCNNREISSQLKMSSAEDQLQSEYSQAQKSKSTKRPRLDGGVDADGRSSRASGNKGWETEHTDNDSIHSGSTDYHDGNTDGGGSTVPLGAISKPIQVVDFTKEDKTTLAGLDINRTYAFCLDGDVTVNKLMEDEDFGGTVVAWRKAGGWGGLTLIVRRGPPAFGQYRVMSASEYGFPFEKKTAPNMTKHKLSKTQKVIFKGILAIAFRDSKGKGVEAIAPGISRMPLTYIWAQWRTEDGSYITSWESRTDFKKLKRGDSSHEWIYKHCRHAEQRSKNERYRQAEAVINRKIKQEEGQGVESYQNLPQFRPAYQGDPEGDTDMGNSSSVEVESISDDGNTVRGSPVQDTQSGGTRSITRSVTRSGGGTNSGTNSGPRHGGKNGRK